MTSSGVTTYDPTVSDLTLDAFDRCQIRAASLTPDHMFSARRSIQSVLVRWSNNGINLWEVREEVTPLIEGVSTYAVPTDTITMLDTWVRTYQIAQAGSYPVAFSTVNGSDSVLIEWPNHGQSVGNWINVVVPVSVGGVVVLGYYQVQTVPSSDQVTIIATTATSDVTNGGAVPVFSTTAGSGIITVALDDNGYQVGDTFMVQVTTTVGGLNLLGGYTVTSAGNLFTIDYGYDAGSTETVSENGGEASLAGQVANAQPFDRVLGSISRTDYAGTANKFVQAAPTSFWFDRQISPQVTLWPVPDGNGPYELRYYRMRQVETATPAGAQTMDLPYRFLEAFTAAVAASLALRWNPQIAPALLSYAKECWAEAAGEDRERVPLQLYPNLGGYYR